jgi:Flp pilus assembly protein TadG
MKTAGQYKLKMLKTIGREFRRNQSGAIAVYVGLLLLVLGGVGALTLDLGRLFVTGTETQSYVDAAALAGAYQLDGQAGARARATEAINDKLFTNTQALGALNSGAATNSVTIDSIVFLSSLVGNVVATSDADANFVQVTANSTDVENSLIGLLGGPDTSRAVRAATAGNTQVICEIPPLMMCNPNETAGNTSFSVPAGSQYVAKYTGPGAGMAPGTFGLLDSPTCGAGSKCIAELLGHRRPASGCFSATVDIRPGQANGVRNALNTRFDMYENPFFNSKKNDANYHAALNVTKGYVETSGGSCPNLEEWNMDDHGAPELSKFPRDSCYSDGTCARIGDGDWDRTKYWDINHAPSGHTQPPGYATMSRYDVYRWEIDFGKIPNVTGVEDGNPSCNVPASDPADRRTFIMAVVNCLEQNVAGNTDDVEVVTYMEVFLTEPVSIPSDAPKCTGGGGETPTECEKTRNQKMEFVVEMIREVSPGSLDGVLHDMVQLYR